jgi:hypothetical protein
MCKGSVKSSVTGFLANPGIKEADGLEGLRIHQPNLACVRDRG